MCGACTSMLFAVMLTRCFRTMFCVVAASSFISLFPSMEIVTKANNSDRHRRRARVRQIAPRCYLHIGPLELFQYLPFFPCLLYLSLVNHILLAEAIHWTLAYSCTARDTLTFNVCPAGEFSLSDASSDFFPTREIRPSTHHWPYLPDCDRLPREIQTLVYRSTAESKCAMDHDRRQRAESMKGYID